MDKYILNLTANESVLANTGGKGANLTRLLQGGFPVPPGFVLTTAAYHAFVSLNGLQPLINATWETLVPQQPESFAQGAATLRAAFAGGRLPELLHTAVSTAFTSLGNTAVAVRSSATAEDLPNASFAGQQDTYLNVQTVADLETAVIACWASLWTARAMAYRLRQNILPDAVSLAVVIQAMIPAEVAGVLFTLNPVTGATDEMMVNATWGLGEALVGGQVNPDSYILDKANGRIKQANISEKLVMTTRTASGTTETAVPEPQRRAPTLTTAEAATLARLGRDIETHFGQPQDIEWAMAHGQVMILQARPVTAVDGAAMPHHPTPSPDHVPGDDAWPPTNIPAQPFDRWTQADVGERWPEAVTPFTWSTWEPMINENMAQTFGNLHNPEFDRIHWVKRAYGRVYLNEGAMIYAFHRGFGFPISMMEASLQNPELAAPEERQWRWGRVLATLPITLSFMRTWEGNINKFEQDFPRLEAWATQFMTRDLRQESDAALWQEAFQVWQPRIMEYMTYHANVLSTSLTAFSTMRGLMGRWMGDESLVYDLIGGLSGVITAEIVPALWQLIAELRRAGLDEIVSQQEPAVALEMLRQQAAARPFLTQLTAFLQRHGHRAITEAEWRYPRWIEAPELVIETLAGYLHTGTAPNLAATEAQLTQRRLATTSRVEAKVGPLRRGYFRWGLQRLQRLMRLRDNGQHYLVQLALPMRRLFATLAQRWTERGWLATPDDFYFLVVAEIEQVLAAGSPAAADLNLAAGIGGVAAQRRLAYEYWRTQPLIEVLDAHGKPWTRETAVSASDPHTLQGIPASAGQITGPARLITSPSEANRLQPGDILVTRATDPGWTPVFSVISGLVLEIGGQLSHGAIVAREYGLPAVVNAPAAMQRITDGQIITVNGATGVVVLRSEN